MNGRHRAVEHRAAVHEQRLAVRKLQIPHLVDARAEVAHAGRGFVRHAEIADRIGEDVQRIVPAVQLHGVAAALGERKFDFTAMHARLNALGQRTDGQIVEIAAGDETHRHRLAHLEAQERRDLGLIHRALMSRPDGVVGHGGHAAEPRQRFFAVERHGKIRDGDFGFGRMVNFQHGVFLIFQVEYFGRTGTAFGQPRAYAFHYIGWKNDCQSEKCSKKAEAAKRRLPKWKTGIIETALQSASICPLSA